MAMIKPCGARCLPLERNPAKPIRERARRMRPLTGSRSGATKQDMKFIGPIFAALHLTTFIASAEAPTADQVLSPAKAKASAEQKAIFLHFGAIGSSR
jgi:hypothetical protein